MGGWEGVTKSICELLEGAHIDDNTRLFPSSSSVLQIIALSLSLLVLLPLRLLLDGVLSRELGLEVPLAEVSLLSQLLAAVGVLALLPDLSAPVFHAEAFLPSLLLAAARVLALGPSAPVRDAEASLLSMLLAAVGVLALGPRPLLLLPLRFLAVPLPRLARGTKLFLVLLLVLRVGCL